MDLNIIIIQMDVRFLMRNLEVAEWLKHQTVNLGYVGSSPTVPANIKLMQQINTYAELRKLKLNKLFKHPTYNISSY